MNDNDYEAFVERMGSFEMTFDIDEEEDDSSDSEIGDN